ncbi:4-coumarate--CoA ligase-like 9 [Impatiens glandulifera]|uniref:4-coumarate--CoA ligase-like 9 n=1 Tax=Impatiens glandulifera TaxID=253017 RepID=UPI001FB0975B|nr:4-coumarate--CoA ligase-like 9 [Impatiens glandulifera]
MTNTKSDQINPNNGFSSLTKTFHSLRPPVPLPPPTQNLSISDYVTHLLHLSTTASSSPFPPEIPFIIDATTDQRLTYNDFFRQTKSLASSIKKLAPSLSPNDVAFILVPPSINVPVLYFALLSIGLTISPANPLATESELTHMVEITKPVIAFATSLTVGKLPPIPLGTVLIDSAEFQIMMESDNKSGFDRVPVTVRQSDSAAILYSSGTTGRVKGVELTHRNFIALISGFHHIRSSKEDNMMAPIWLLPIPLFHVFGFFIFINAAARGETVVLLERFEFEAMLKAVEKYRVSLMPVSPPLLIAMSKLEIVKKYDLSSLQILTCGGAPFGKEMTEKFLARFPNIEISQGYGLTETVGGASRMIGEEEAKHYGSAGRLSENLEAKIIDPETGEALGPERRGELWLRGPIIMKGYIGDKAATLATLDGDGWLKTGDLCYIDKNGYLYVVDRLKELIKYKGYQVPPAELERLLQSHPEIADSAVIPYPDDDAGEIPMAFVVRKARSSINDVQIMEYIAKLVAPYKKIRRLSFVAAIPKSPAGKILRRELVKHATSASSRL